MSLVSEFAFVATGLMSAMTPALLGEMALMLWLLIKGVKEPAPDRR